MPKWMILLVLLLIFSAPCIIVWGVYQNQQAGDTWQDEMPAVAETLCEPNETLNITRTESTTRRTRFDYWCVDEQGNQRDIDAELAAIGRTRLLKSLTLVFVGIGMVFLGTLLAAYGVRRQKKVRLSGNESG